MKKIFLLSSLLLLSILNYNAYAQAGALDLSFGTNGKVVTSLSNTGHSYAIASVIQSDGKIVVAGHTYMGFNLDYAITRYNIDGSLDSSFSTDGLATLDLGDNDEFCYSVSLQTDGKIVLTGGTNNMTALAIVRFNANGSIDSTFDNDGIVIPNISTAYVQGFNAVIQSDNKIVVATQSFNGPNVDFAIIRLNTNGTLDSTFDADGKVYIDLVGDDIAAAIALQTDGKIVVGGMSNSDFVVVRLNTNGSLDNTFDTDGKVRTPITIGDDEVSAMAIQSDGKIVLTGSSNIAGNVHTLVRYTTNGSLDTSFDTDGILITQNICLSNDMKIQNDGKIIVVGTYPVGVSMDFVVVRYNANGTLDTTFDADGFVTTDFGISKDDMAYATSIQSDGKIIAAGHGYALSLTNFMVMRYNSGVVTNLSNVSALNYTIYPNPTTGLVYFQNLISNYKVNVINNSGQQVHTTNCSASKPLIDVTHLPVGIYSVMLHNGTDVQTFKLQKD